MKKPFWKALEHLSLLTRQFQLWMFILPLGILAGLIIGIQLFQLSFIKFSNTSFIEGSIYQVEEDFTGYEDRLRYKIVLEKDDEPYFIQNIFIDKLKNVQLLAAGGYANIHYQQDRNEPLIVALTIDSHSILDIADFRDRYRRLLIINTIGTIVFALWFVRIVLSRKKIQRKS